MYQLIILIVLCIIDTNQFRFFLHSLIQLLAGDVSFISPDEQMDKPEAGRMQLISRAAASQPLHSHRGTLEGGV